MKESPVQRLILDWLAAEHILGFRMNTGVAKFEDRFVAFGVKGMADVLAFKRIDVIDGRRVSPMVKWHEVFWIETKSPVGKQSSFQKSFQEQVEGYGHHYILAKTLEDVKERMQ